MKTRFTTNSIVITLGMTLIFATVAAAQKAKDSGHGRGKKVSVATNFGKPKVSKPETSVVGKANLNRYKGLSKKLGRTPESLRDWYESERTRNPRLTHGQFVAANMLARNKRKGISAQTILDGLRNGDSIGQILHRRGMSEKDIKEERKRIRKMADEDRDFGFEYDDRDSYWRTRR